MAALAWELPLDITPDEAHLMPALRLIEEHRISLGNFGLANCAFRRIR
jgi:hypothetical protein